VDPEALNDLPAAGEVLHLFQDEITNVTFVGCVTEVRGRQHGLIQIFAHYHKYLNPRSRLFVVLCGHPQADDCVQEFRSETERHGLTNHVHVAARVSRAELKAHYLISHALLCMSQTPGIHTPAVHGMYYQMPVVAWSASALRGTLGDEALVWDELNPAVLAQSLHYCLENRAAGEFLAQRQHERYRMTFSPEADRRRFVTNHLARLGG
jgi:hypothetical protein